MSNLFVCLMGIGTVFIGLFCIVIICTIMSTIIRMTEDKPAPAENKTANVPQPIVNKGELVAAISAAVAEELGEDVSAIRIKSIKRI